MNNDAQNNFVNGNKMASKQIIRLVLNDFFLMVNVICVNVEAKQELRTISCKNNQIYGRKQMTEKALLNEEFIIG